MIETKSYIDPNGQVIIDGHPLQFQRRQQNLRAKPSRHRKPVDEIDEQAYIRSFKDAAASIICVMLFATAMALFLAWVKY